MPHGPAHATPFVITETDDLTEDYVNTDGTITLNPGETKKLCEYRIRNDGSVGHILGYGATDASNVDYIFEVDETPKFSTKSPLGLVNNPFSFKREMGYAYPVEKYAVLKVTMDSSASSSKKMAGRMFATEGGV